MSSAAFSRPSPPKLAALEAPRDAKRLEMDAGSGIPNAFTTRRVPREEMRWLLTGQRPEPGDLVLARIEGLGHHTRLQLPNRSRRQLFPGDEVVLAYGHRYAAQQFEAFVPPDLGDCHLVAAGGVAGRVVARHGRIVRGPTRIRPLGLVAAQREGRVLNLRDFALAEAPEPTPGQAPVLAVLGTSMDSGKTTTAGNLARGLIRYGLRVGYAKVTGTGAAGDPGLLIDAGAAPVLDFTDLGYVSTYRLAEREVLAIFRALLGQLQASRVDVALVEVADGLLQQETAALLGSDCFREHVDAVLFAAGDSMGASAGVDWLRRHDLPTLAVAGALESAPLEAREAEKATGLPVLRRAELADAGEAAELLRRARPGWNG